MARGGGARPRRGAALPEVPEPVPWLLCLEGAAGLTGVPAQ